MDPEQFTQLIEVVVSIKTTIIVIAVLFFFMCLISD